MEKTLTYEEYVRVKNLLTKIKGHVQFIDKTKQEVNNDIDKINEILNIKLHD